jgi:hypothetical protein
MHRCARCGREIPDDAEAGEEWFCVPGPARQIVGADSNT